MKTPARWMIRVGLCAWLTICAAGVISAAGTHYYVALDGGDTNDGLSREAAFATVQRGVDALASGDTLIIAPGEYFGAVSREKLGGPDEKREMFMFYGGDAWMRAAEVYGFDPERPSAISDLTRMSLKAYQERFGDTGSIVADPRFKWTLEMEAQDTQPYRGFVPHRPLNKRDLDFTDIFATHPEVVQKGIGLQPQAFADFHFNRGE